MAKIIGALDGSGGFTHDDLHMIWWGREEEVKHKRTRKNPGPGEKRTL
jgi:hypothetical protein